MSTLFINEFQKGSKENANIGLGNLVGVETYSKKGVAQLTRDSFKVSGSVVIDLPVYFAALDDTTIFAQGNQSHVYKSTDAGNTWTDISNPPSIGDGGQGLIVFEGYVFAFHGSKIDYLSSPYGVGNWTTNWKTGLIGSPHFAFIFPNDNFVYFANANKIGKIGFGTATVFNPGGVQNTDYFYNDARLTLPSFYNVNCISFLPVNFLALGTSSNTNTEVADIILWNPALNTYETPLRLYSQAIIGENGVRQIINRNNVLYAVTGGSHSIFATNGTTFNLVADLSLYSNIRKVTGAQSQEPVFMNPRYAAIDVFGNKLLTGVAITNGITYSPNYGLFPCGVWSVAFTDEGESFQCEYTLSTNQINSAAFNFFVGALKCIGSNKTLIGWQSAGDTGIDLVSTTDFQNDISTVLIESEMMEIGTPLEPATVQTIQLNLTRNLMTGQTIQVNYRTAFEQDWVALQTFTVAQDGASTGYKVVTNPIGATQFLQLQIQMATNTPNIISSPELRTVIISG